MGSWSNKKVVQCGYQDHGADEHDGRRSESFAGQIAGRHHAQPSRWTAEEDKELSKSVNKLGAGKWTAIAENMKSRDGKQCRERWCNHLDPKITKGPWKPWEYEKLADLQKQHGNSWVKIAEDMDGRAPNDIKNQWNSTLKRKLEREQIVHWEQQRRPPRSATTAFCMPSSSTSDRNLPSTAPPQCQPARKRVLDPGQDVRRVAAEERSEDAFLDPGCRIPGPPVIKPIACFPRPCVDLPSDQDQRFFRAQEVQPQTPGGLKERLSWLERRLEELEGPLPNPAVPLIPQWNIGGSLGLQTAPTGPTHFSGGAQGGMALFPLPQPHHVVIPYPSLYFGAAPLQCFNPTSVECAMQSPGLLTSVFPPPEVSRSSMAPCESPITPVSRS